MIVFNSPHFNIDLGLLNRLHPFDGMKFDKVMRSLRKAGLSATDVSEPLPERAIDTFVGDNLRHLLHARSYVLQALEVPRLPLVPFGWIRKKVLTPMAWGVAGTLAATRRALDEGRHCWNLSGGYHHASRDAAEGFCLYNDVGIAVQQLRESGALGIDERVLIIDVDAHHGNGNGHVFKNDPDVEILDIYNADIYPFSPSTKKRVNVGIPLPSFTPAADYLRALELGLKELHPARVAFVIAGTDVLSTDPLGRLSLSVQDCVERDRLVLDALDRLETPGVFLGGGGYGKDSAQAMSDSIVAHGHR